MMDAVKHWFQEQRPRGIVVEGIDQLVRQWNACSTIMGLYLVVQDNPE
jgi:hypothetical protein